MMDLRRRLFPQLPGSDRLRVAVRSQPAEGNDWPADIYVGWIQDNCAYRVILVDIEGHGNCPAYLGTALLGALRQAIMDAHKGLRPWPSYDPVETLAWTETVLLNLQGFPDEMRLTGSVLGAAGASILVNMMNGRVTVGGQALPGFFWHHSGSPRMLTLHGPILAHGYSSDCEPEIHHVDLTPSDRLYFVTDGLLDCFDTKKTPFLDRICEALVELRDLEIGAAPDALLRRACDHRSATDPEDDATVIAMQWQ